MEIHNRAKFHLLHICGCQVIYFQSLSYQQKGAFWAAFGWFLVDYKPKSSRICIKFSPVMKYKVKYHICHGFWYSFENWKNGAKKHFLAFFQRFSDHAPRTPLCHAQIFCQTKGIIDIHNRAKFHFHSVCGSQVKNFQNVSWRWTIHELVHFGVFFDPNSPKYDPTLLKLSPEVVPKESNRAFQKVLANSNF